MDTHRSVVCRVCVLQEERRTLEKGHADPIARLESANGTLAKRLQDEAAEALPRPRPHPPAVETTPPPVCVFCHLGVNLLDNGYSRFGTLSPDILCEAHYDGLSMELTATGLFKTLRIPAPALLGAYGARAARAAQPATRVRQLPAPPGKVMRGSYARAVDHNHTTQPPPPAFAKNVYPSAGRWMVVEVPRPRQPRQGEELVKRAASVHAGPSKVPKLAAQSAPSGISKTGGAELPSSALSQQEERPQPEQPLGQQQQQQPLGSSATYGGGILTVNPCVRLVAKHQVVARKYSALIHMPALETHFEIEVVDSVAQMTVRSPHTFRWYRWKTPNRDSEGETTRDIVDVGAALAHKLSLFEKPLTKVRACAMCLRPYAQPVYAPVQAAVLKWFASLQGKDNQLARDTWLADMAKAIAG